MENENKPVCCRGIRGATTVSENTQEEILRGTRELLALMIRLNDIQPEDVASAWFTTTPDLDACFPAIAARQLNWMNVALMCGHEMSVDSALPLCIRILIHWNTTKNSDDIVHVYIKGAKKLRPDKNELPAVDWKELEEWILQEMKNNSIKPADNKQNK